MEPRPLLSGWIGRTSAATLDWWIVLVLTALGLVSTGVDPFVHGDRTVYWPKFGLAVALTLVQTIPLYWRRTRPNLVLLLVAGAFAAKTLLGINATIAGFGLFIAMYSLAAYGSGRRRLWALAITALIFVAGFAAFAITGNPRSIAVSVPSVAFAAAWFIGDYLGTRRRYVAALEERAKRLERERRLDRQLAADEERARIARELHDVVAHDVSVIAIQAGAARTVQATSPDAAAEALALIETTARKTLGELSQLLGVLRKSDGDAAQRAPQPGLSQVNRLVDELRLAGISVDYGVEGEVVALPPALELSAYRVLQESTTNILKHAGARHAQIRITYRPTELILGVRDDGKGGQAPPSASGHGLVGMRERVSLFGGRLDTGPLKGGGFEVQAQFPVAATS